MTTILARLQKRLHPYATYRGFTLANAGVTTGADGDDPLLLEYRAGSPGRHCVLLDCCQIPVRQKITVELWSPDDLAGLRSESSVDTVAIQRQVWRYDHTDDPLLLATQIFDEVAEWLDRG